MRIAWISHAATNSQLASHRYRVLMPAEALRQLGHSVDVLAPQALAGVDWRSYESLVVGKLLPLGQSAGAFTKTTELVAAAVQFARDSGVRVAADFNDDHFETPGLSEHWQRTAQTCHVAVVSTPALAQRVQQFGAAQTVVIGDPVAAPRAEPRFYQPTRGVAAGLMKLLPGSAPPRLRLAWFGTRGSWPAMKALLPSLAGWSAGTATHLTVVTDGVDGIEAQLTQATQQSKGQLLTEFIPWTESEQWSALGRAHVVLLPADISKGFAQAKSANRLIDSIQSGCWTIASPVPAYEEFAAFADVTDDFTAALNRYLQAPQTGVHRIAAGQAKIESQHSAQALASRWLDAFSQLSGRSQSGSAAAAPVSAPARRPTVEPALIKLNLGCGDKLLSGYINVDVVQERAGKQPDVNCDIRNLDIFETDYANEVLAVHVVEHFWRWEVVDILREWVRVLKPGGKLILECPNLISACETFLANPEAASGPGPEGQRSMWVFYGDPRWTDPLMVHRWGYTPKSLGSVMAEAGLIDIRQEAAQYKLREPRDMRVVGVKPGFAGAL
jgi:hypothetical protein